MEHEEGPYHLAKTSPRSSHYFSFTAAPEIFVPETNLFNEPILHP